MADAPGERTEQPPRSTSWRGVALVAVCLVAGAVGGRLLRNGLPAPRVRYSADPRLDRAARAVVHGADAKARPTLVQGKAPMALPPLAAFLNRENVVRLAAECASLRGQALDALQADGPGRPARAGGGRPDRLRARPALHLPDPDDQQAQLALYALGWPYVGRKAEDWKPAALPAPSSLPADLDACLAVARAAPAWPSAEQQLEDRGLTDEQVFAVRAELLRRALAGAFDADDAADAARDALGRCADLAPAQADAVLAMAGAQALASAGQEAVPALKVMAEKHPALAQAVRDAVH